LSSLSPVAISLKYSFVFSSTSFSSIAPAITTVVEKSILALDAVKWTEEKGIGRLAARIFDGYVKTKFRKEREEYLKPEEKEFVDLSGEENVF